MGNNSQMISLLYIVAFCHTVFPDDPATAAAAEKTSGNDRSIKPDDRVITIGGNYGTIVKIKDNSIILKVADNVRMEFLKTAISQVSKQGRSRRSGT